MTRHFLRDDDLSSTERTAVLDLAVEMKRDRFAHQVLAGPQTVALMFDKPSTRTRVSFTVGVAELGGTTVILDTAGTQMGRGEPIIDTARVLDRQVAAIVWRTYAQANLDEMAESSRVPVINSLSNEFHPCQVLADLLTIKEHKGSLAGLTFTYLGDIGNNMAHSYLLACVSSGMHVRLAGPEGNNPDGDVLKAAEELAVSSGGSVVIARDAKAAAHESDVLATDTWASMGSEKPDENGLAAFRPFAIDQALIDVAAEEAIVMHCLPAYRGYEISAEVLENKRCVAFDQAENRLHVQKALLAFLLGETSQQPTRV